MSFIKHVGKFGEKPCVIMFRELPGDDVHCLIVQTGSLPERMHDELMNALQTAEVQQSNSPTEVLQRKQFSDGQPMLNALHYGNYMQKVPISHVSLTPQPNSSVPLADVNAEINKIEGGYTAPINDEVHLNEGKKAAEPTKAPPAVAPSTEASVESTGDDIAQGLLMQGQLMMEDAKSLESEATAKMEEAYNLDPSLRPVKRGRPKKAENA